MSVIFFWMWFFEFRTPRRSDEETQSRKFVWHNWPGILQLLFESFSGPYVFWAGKKFSFRVQSEDRLPLNSLLHLQMKSLLSRLHNLSILSSWNFLPFTKSEDLLHCQRIIKNVNAPPTFWRREKREAEIDFWNDFFCAIFICCERNMNTNWAGEWKQKKNFNHHFLCYQISAKYLLLVFRDDAWFFCGLTQETREIMSL